MEEDQTPQKAPVSGSEAEKQPDPPEANAEAEDVTEGGDFVSRYQSAKERDIVKLSQEIEARHALDNKARHRKWWIKTVLLLLLIGASIAILFGITDSLTDASVKSFVAMVREANWKYFLMLIGAVLLFMFFESAKYAYLLKISTGKFRFRNSVKVMFLGKYYDGITPLGSGGEPFQIYYLHKKDIPAGVATAVPLVRFVVSTFVFCTMAAVFFIVAPHFLTGAWSDTAILVIAWISMGLNFLVPVAIVFVSFFPNTGKKITAWIVRVLSKMHIVKHKYPTMRKYVYEINEYRQSLKAIIRKWWLILPLALLSVCSTFFSVSIPFFVVVFIADIPPTFDLLWQMLCLSFIAFYSASFVPTPGNSVAVETTASIIFATVLVAYPQVSSMLGWVILVWRLFTYYIYILSGIGINIFEIIRSAVRNRRAARAAKKDP